MLIVDLLSELINVEVTGDRSYIACCPAHSDEKASLSVAESDDGKILLHCHAGCETKDVLAALGLTSADLAPEAPSAPATSPTPPAPWASPPQPARAFVSIENVNQGGEDLPDQQDCQPQA
jgi:hypothetical protein